MITFAKTKQAAVSKYCTLLLSAFIMIFLFSCKKKDENDLNELGCSSINSNYRAHVKPIIDANCISSGCHNSESINGDYTEYEGVGIAAALGSFSKRVIEDQDMPLGTSLSIDNLRTLKCWLEAGAPEN